MPEFTARFIPSRGRTSLPRWFTRDAILAYELSPYEAVAMMIIADNLDAQGVSRTATIAVASRGGMGRRRAGEAIELLVAEHLLVELDPRSPGKIMRYAIPVDMPWIPTWKDR